MLLEKEKTLKLSEFPYMNKIHSTALKIEEIKEILTPIYEKEEKNFLIFFMTILLLTFCGFSYISIEVLALFFKNTSLNLLFLFALPTAMLLEFFLQKYLLKLFEKDEDKFLKFFNKKSRAIQKEKESLLDNINFLKTTRYQEDLKEFILKLRPESGDINAVEFEINYAEMLRCWTEKKYLDSTKYINNLLNLNLYKQKQDDLNYKI